MPIPAVPEMQHASGRSPGPSMCQHGQDFYKRMKDKRMSPSKGFIDRFLSWLPTHKICGIRCLTEFLQNEP